MVALMGFSTVSIARGDTFRHAVHTLGASLAALSTFSAIVLEAGLVVDLINTSAEVRHLGLG